MFHDPCLRETHMSGQFKDFSNNQETLDGVFTELQLTSAE